MPASFRGCSGKVTLAGNAVGHLTDWDYEIDAEEIDVSVMGTCTSSSEPGNRTTRGNINALFDLVDDAAQAAMLSAVINATTGALVIRPFGDGVGNAELTGTAKFLNTGARAAVSGRVEATFRFTLDGDWTVANQV